jgi:predicted DsbA family dithiol-disulfide isomerase
MPFDPSVWFETPISSTYPACMAVKAAFMQGQDVGLSYLRALREGILCFGRKLDHPEALIAEARGLGIDLQRFRTDLSSNATVEAFGDDLSRASRLGEDFDLSEPTAASGEHTGLPAMVFFSSEGTGYPVAGVQSYDAYERAALSAGAQRQVTSPPDVMQALKAFERLATAELEAVCELALPPLNAELWSLARDWKVRPIRVLTGYLWQLQ